MCDDQSAVITIKCDECHENIECDDHDDCSDTNHKGKIWNHPLMRQIFIALCPVLCIFSSGISLGTPTVLIPQILQNNEFELTKDMQSWLYSIYGIATWPAVIALPYLSEKFGRRTVCFTSCITICTAWMLTYFAKSYPTLLIAEILDGYVIGANVVTGMLIGSEYSDPKYRASFLVFQGASFNWGVWIGNAIGAFTDSRYNCLVGFITGLLSFLILIYIPESPIWLASEGNYEKSKQSFTWIRGTSKKAISDFQEMFEYYSKPKGMSNDYTNFIMKIKRYGKLMLTKHFYMPFSLCIVCFSLFHFTGKMVITMYSLVIIEEITHDKGLAYKTMLVIDAISVFGMYVGCYTSAKIRRRVLVTSTTVAAIIIMYINSILLFLSQYNIYKVNDYIVLGLLLLYSISISLGPVSLTLVIFAEIVPYRYKTSIITSTTVFNFGLHTLLVKSNMFLMENIKISGVFCFFGTMTSLSFLYLYCFLPETKNKSLLEIEKYFKSKSIFQRNVKKILSNDE